MGTLRNAPKRLPTLSHVENENSFLGWVGSHVCVTLFEGLHAADLSS